MLVSHILTDKGRTVVSCAADATLADAARLLARHRIGAVVVMGEGDSLSGILSERDIVRVLALEGPGAMAHPIHACMTVDVETVEETDTVDEIMERMTHGRFRHLPVVEGTRVVGLVSIGDVVKSRIEETLREAQALKDYIATS